MLAFLVEKSLRFRAAVLALAVVLVLYGVHVTRRAKLDVFPDFVPPQVVIQTEAPGLSPGQVEALVTRAVERSANGVGELESLRSQSIQGLSIVTATFEERTDVFRARQLLNERLAEAAAELPQGVRAPKMTPLTSATMDLLKLALTSQALSPMELRTFADWTLRPALQAVQGVASVNVYGGDVRQLQVQVRPDRLAVYGVSLDEVLAAARAASGVRGAGYVETETQRVVLQCLGQSISAEDLGGVAVRCGAGDCLRLRDVANVREAGAPKFGDALFQGKPCVFLALLSQYGANTLEVTERVEHALDLMEPLFKATGVILHRDLFRPAGFIESAIRNISRSLLMGGVLVAIVLFLFLWNLRTAMISLTAIPLSLLVAVVVLDRCGATLNTITLGGLAIAIGEVVDDAIIDVENIFRRLRENQACGAPSSAFRVVLDASLEVRGAVVYATLIVALVFLPVLTMSGLQGRLFAPLGQAYILAVLASLVVAVTVTPALSLLLLPRRAAQASEPRAVAWLRAAYGAALIPLARRPWTVVVAVCGLSAGTLWLFQGFGGEFLPQFREGHFVAHMNAVPGTSLEGSRRLGAQVADSLLGREDILTVPQQIGRAELGEDPWGPHRSEFHINITPNLGKGEDSVQESIREVMATVPGITYDITTFLGDRIGETISGETAEVAVSVFGDDLDALDREAERIAGVLAGLGGARDVQVASPPGAPQMIVEPRAERLRQFGLRPVEVMEAVQTAFQGTAVSQTLDGDRVFDIVVILDDAARRDPEAVGSLLLRGAEGSLVPLHRVAEVYGTTGRYMLLHDGARRRQVITCNVQGRDLASFVDEAKTRVATGAAAGTYVEFSGTAETRAQAQQELLLHSGIAAIGIIILLLIVVGRLANLLLVLVNVPFALVGGVLAVLLTGASVSIGSLVGFITVFGITTRNSIMMLSHFDHLVGVDGAAWALETAVRGATERLVPVCMTAMVTGLGLLPIALGADAAGREIEGPMAVVILGGLATSTVLNLMVLPTLALRFGRFPSTASEDQDVGV
ncbi:MAG: efflux RND transporter permease subunit [Planctomycetes bacterium]|nr:efflux RND transporter permease subunit [Planctomycetota bacterium]